jgi:hypothetical protein
MVATRTAVAAVRIVGSVRVVIVGPIANGLPSGHSHQLRLYKFHCRCQGFGLRAEQQEVLAIP